MNITFSINGREALPVRAIPFVTGWLMSPDMVASSLAHSDLVAKLRKISAYHLVNRAKPMPMLPKEWDGIESDLQILSAKLKATEVIDHESYPIWRRESIKLLPADVFVWRDEFTTAFERTYAAESMGMVDERPGDRQLNLSPFIPQESREAVMEGLTVHGSPAVKVWPRSQTGEFRPLSVELAGFWETPFDQLPDAVKPFAMEFEPIGWKGLDPQRRQQIAAEIDWQYDPRCEPSLYFELNEYQSELQIQESVAREQKNHGVALALVDVQTRIEKILNTDRAKVGCDIQGLRKLRVVHQELLVKQALLESKVEQEKPLNQRQESSYLNTIAVLLELIQEPRPGRGSAAAVIKEMVENYKDAYGISKAQLEKTFALANRNLRAS